MNRKMANRASDYCEDDSYRFTKTAHHAGNHSFITNVHLQITATAIRYVFRQEALPFTSIFNTAYTLLNIKYILIGTGLRDNGYAYARLLYYLFRTEFPFIMNEAPSCAVLHYFS
jgi:hypothetical protein